MEFRGCPKAIPSRLGKRCAVVAAYEQTSGAGSPQGAAVTCPGEIDVSVLLSAWQKPVPITGRLARKEPAGLSAAADVRNKQ